MNRFSIVHLLLDALMVVLCLAGIVMAFYGISSWLSFLLIGVYLPCSAYSLFTGKWRRDRNGHPLVTHN